MDSERDPRLYVRIRAQLARKITEGELSAGSKLPTEKQLAAQHGCGTDAAQRALQMLAEDGLARRTPGRGYFSLGGPAHHIQLPARPLAYPAGASDMVAKRMLSSVALARAHAGPAATLPALEGP
jgi:DNA-binding FadR family transcriptional regulator